MRVLRTDKDIVALVREIGFLPFFAGGIAGFSVEELCPADLWFREGVDGPWEWKSPIIGSGECVYGKVFGGKAGFVSKEWLPDFANYRRDGYDFDSRCDEGIAPHKDRYVFETVSKSGAILSKELKRRCNFRKGGNVGFETVITRLQMQLYVTVSDFVYLRDKKGKPYGWGVAEYTTPEARFGYDFVTSAYGREPKESGARIAEHLRKLLPSAPDAAIAALLG